MLAIGAPYNDGNGLSSGHVRVFSWNGTLPATMVSTSSPSTPPLNLALNFSNIQLIIFTDCE